MNKSTTQQLREKAATISTSRPFVGQKITLRVDLAEYEDSTSRKIEIIEHPGAALIVPITSKGNILFIKQYRPAVGKILIELPAGTLEEGEKPIDCARRELEEETGFKANKIISLSGFYTTPGFCTEYIHIFIAKELTLGTPKLDEDEGIDPLELSLDEACERVDKNIIVDGKTIISIFKYLRWIKQDHEC